MRKNILLFTATFLFIQLMEIYIVGGWYEQTTMSKFLACFLGGVSGLISVSAYNELNNKQ